MKDCPEIEELLVQCIGDNVVGFFEQNKSSEELDVSVFTLVSNNSVIEKLVN